MQPDTTLPKEPAVKEYIALLTQTGTADPTAEILKNTLGETIVWTRTDVGEYVGTKASDFDNTKTWATIQNIIPGTADAPASVQLEITALVNIIVWDSTYVVEDDQLIKTPIEIRVFK